MRGDALLKIKVLALAGLSGAAMIALVSYVILPAIVQRLTAPQIAWLREIFNVHTSLVLLALLVTVAFLGLPVLLVALWAARLGPWKR